MNIATRLDKAMAEARIPSQAALARASGVPQPTINRILKGDGKRGPETETLVKLAAACNVSFDWLREGTGPQGRAPKVRDQGTGGLDPVSPVVDPAEIEPPMYAFITVKEARLLSLYRTTDDDGKDDIMSTAEESKRVILPGLAWNKG